MESLNLLYDSQTNEATCVLDECPPLDAAADINYDGEDEPITIHLNDDHVRFEMEIIKDGEITTGYVEKKLNKAARIHLQQAETINVLHPDDIPTVTVRRENGDDTTYLDPQ